MFYVDLFFGLYKTSYPHSVYMDVRIGWQDLRLTSVIWKGIQIIMKNCGIIKFWFRTHGEQWSTFCECPMGFLFVYSIFYSSLDIYMYKKSTKSNFRNQYRNKENLILISLLWKMHFEVDWLACSGSLIFLAQSESAHWWSGDWWRRLKPNTRLEC